MIASSIDYYPDLPTSFLAPSPSCAFSLAMLNCSVYAPFRILDSVIQVTYRSDSLPKNGRSEAYSRAGTSHVERLLEIYAREYG